MTYTVNNSTLLVRIREEVSRLAMKAYSDDGSSLYDAIVIKSKDESIVSDLIADAIDVIVARLADICKLSNTTLTITAPDMASDSTTVTREITRYITLSAVAAWLQDRYVAKYESYANRAASSLEKLVILIKTRAMV